MSLRFIIGWARSGKTRTCLDRFARNLRHARPVPRWCCLCRNRPLLTEYMLATTPLKDLSGLRRWLPAPGLPGAGEVEERPGPISGKASACSCSACWQRRKEIGYSGAQLAGRFCRLPGPHPGEIKNYCIEPADRQLPPPPCATCRGRSTAGETGGPYLLYNDLEEFLRPLLIRMTT